jgi:hypothetical protein
MKPLRKVYYSLVVCALGLFSAVVTFAAEEGGSSAEHSTELLFKWIHFAILAGLVYGYSENCCRRYSAGMRKPSAPRSPRRPPQGGSGTQAAEAVTKMGNLEREIAEFELRRNVTRRRKLIVCALPLSWTWRKFTRRPKPKSELLNARLALN